MMSAGFAVLQSGPDQLGESRDPATGKPFAYVPTPGGFELQSAYQYRKKPVTMTFAQPEH